MPMQTYYHHNLCTLLSMDIYSSSYFLYTICSCVDHHLLIYSFLSLFINLLLTRLNSTLILQLISCGDLKENGTRKGVKLMGSVTLWESVWPPVRECVTVEADFKVLKS